MILAAVVLLVLGGGRDAGGGAGGDGARPPRLEHIAPRDGETIGRPLQVVFRVPERMERLAGGWGVGDHHLHLELDGVELMPASSDIERLKDGEYRWVVAEPEPGPHALRLLWSGADHRPMPETATPLVRVEVR